MICVEPNVLFLSLPLTRTRAPHIMIISRNARLHHYSRVQWFSLKKKNIYTTVHGRWYNLSGFEHPGGPVALGMAKGRDATALFESHHYFIPRRKLLQILAKYEVSLEESTTLITLDDHEDESPYDWSDIDKDGFASEIRGLVVDYFPSLAMKRGTSVVEATKATPKR